MLATRDKNGDLFIYDTDDKEDVYKEGDRWMTYLDVYGQYIKVPNNLCPDIKWEDKEPTEVEITIKIK